MTEFDWQNFAKYEGHCPLGKLCAKHKEQHRIACSIGAPLCPVCRINEVRHD